MHLANEKVERLLLICRYTDPPSLYVEALQDLLEARKEADQLRELRAVELVAHMQEQMEARKRIAELEAEVKHG